MPPKKGGRGGGGGASPKRNGGWGGKKHHQSSFHPALRDTHVLGEIYGEVCRLLWARAHGNAPPPPHLLQPFLSPEHLSTVYPPVDLETFRQEAPARFPGGFISLSQLCGAPQSAGVLRKMVNRAVRQFMQENSAHLAPKERKMRQPAVVDSVREAVLQYAQFWSDEPLTGGASFVQISRDNEWVRVRPFGSRLRGELQRLFSDRNFYDNASLHILALESRREAAREQEELKSDSSSGVDDNELAIHRAAEVSSCAVYSARVLYRRCKTLAAVFREHPLAVARAVGLLDEREHEGNGKALSGIDDGGVEVDSSLAVTETITEAAALQMIIDAVRGCQDVSVSKLNEMMEGGALGLRKTSLLEKMAEKTISMLSLWNWRQCDDVVEYAENCNGFVPLSYILGSGRRTQERHMGIDTELALAEYLLLRRDELAIDVELQPPGSQALGDGESSDSAVTQAASWDNLLTWSQGPAVRLRAWKHFLNAAGGTDPSKDILPLGSSWPDERIWTPPFSEEAAGPSGSFTILSFNVLVQIYCGEHAYCKASFLRWNYRRALLLRHIDAVRPDVILLQELQGSESSFSLSAGTYDRGDSEDEPLSTLNRDTARDILEALAAMGYTCRFDRKSHENEADHELDLGNALCFRQDKFTVKEEGVVQVGILARNLCEHDAVNYPTESLSELASAHYAQPQVAQYARLALQQSPASSEVVIAGVHLSSHHDAPFLQQTQALLVLRKLEEVSGAWKIPVVLGGDFNSNGLAAPVCRLLAEGIFEVGDDARAFPLGVVAPRVGLPLEENDQGEVHHTLGARLKSAYSQRGDEPEATNCTAKSDECPHRSGFKGLLDYIWFSDGLCVESVLSVPSQAVLSSEGGGIPSSCWPSDHVSLGCRFRFP